MKKITVDDRRIHYKQENAWHEEIRIYIFPEEIRLLLFTRFSGWMNWIDQDNHLREYDTRLPEDKLGYGSATNLNRDNFPIHFKVGYRGCMESDWEEAAAAIQAYLATQPALTTPTRN